MNKRRFRKTLTQNAFYFKAKRSVTMESPINGGRTLFGINANGNMQMGGINSVFYDLRTGSGAGSGYVPTDLPSTFSEIYDQVRLAAVKIKWHPALPAGSIQGPYLPGVLVYDRDGIEGNLQQSQFNNLLEQISGTRTFNMYRPWQKYIKFPKYKLNTRIPSIEQQGGSDIQPNENIAGQWHSIDSHLSSHGFGQNPRGTHILIYLPRNPGSPDEQPQAQGTLVFTTYWVFKDRV